MHKFCCECISKKVLSGEVAPRHETPFAYNYKCDLCGQISDCFENPDMEKYIAE